MLHLRAATVMVMVVALGQGCNEPPVGAPPTTSAVRPDSAPDVVKAQARAPTVEHAERAGKQHLESAHQLLGQAENLAQRGDATAAGVRYGEAKAAYEAARLSRPPNGQALFAAGHCALEQGQVAEAQRLFESALTDLKQETGKPVEPIQRLSQLDKHTSSSKLLAWSSRGDQLAAAEKNRVGLVSPGKPGAIELYASALVRSLRFTPDGAFVVTGSEDGQLELWSALDGTLLWSVPTLRSPIAGLTLTPDGQRILTASADGHVQIRSSSDGLQLPGLGAAAPDPWGSGGGLSDIALSKDGTLLALAGSDSVYMWDLTAKRQVGTLGPHDRAPRTVAISDDGELVASTARDGKTRIWRWKSGTLLAELPGNPLFDASAAFLPGPNPNLVTSSTRLRLWEPAHAALIKAFGDAHGGELAISPDGSAVAAMPKAAAISIWAAKSGALTGQVDLPRQGSVMDVRLCRVGARIFAGELCGS